MPKEQAKSVFYPQSIVSFGDKVALPVFPNGDGVYQNKKISVISGQTNKRVHFERIFYNSPRAVGKQAVVLNVKDRQQTYYLCSGYTKSVKRGCVRFDVIKAK